MNETQGPECRGYMGWCVSGPSVMPSGERAANAQCRGSCMFSDQVGPEPEPAALEQAPAAWPGGEKEIVTPLGATECAEEPSRAQTIMT